MSDEQKNQEREILEAERKSSGDHPFMSDSEYNDMYPGNRFIMIFGVLYYVLFLALFYSKYESQKLQALNLFVLVIMAIPAYFAADLTWKYIGYWPRKILRVMARHWILTLIAALFLLSYVNAVRTGRSFIAPSKGENWVVAENKRGRKINMSRTDAIAYCKSMGGSWRLPKRDELPLLKPQPQFSSNSFWLSDELNNEGHAMGFRYEIRENKISAFTSGGTSGYNVICVN